MTNKITHAPQEIIDLLDKYKETKKHSILNFLSLVNDVDFPQSKWRILHYFMYDPERFYSKDLPYEQAAINHVFGDERLQPEREPKYYVSSEDNDGGTVVYFVGDLGIIGFFSHEYDIPYEQGFSKKLAESIVAEVGGEIKEIK